MSRNASRLAALAACVGFGLALVGCESGGVDALAGSRDDSAAVSGGGGGASPPKTLPKAKRKTRSAAPGPLPPPDR